MSPIVGWEENDCQQSQARTAIIKGQLYGKKQPIGDGARRCDSDSRCRARRGRPIKPAQRHLVGHDPKALSIPAIRNGTIWNFFGLFKVGFWIHSACHERLVLKEHGRRWHWIVTSCRRSSIVEVSPNASCWRQPLGGKQAKRNIGNMTHFEHDTTGVYQQHLQCITDTRSCTIVGCHSGLHDLHGAS